MHKALAAVLFVGALTGVAQAADEPFTKAVPPADFSAAGLGKLTPQELARLDALVRDFKSGALEAARRDAAAAAEARARAEAAAARAEAETRQLKAEVQTRSRPAETKGADTSLLARAKVLLMPGTEIEYTTVESRIVGEFRGWEGRTMFQLENGQRWQADSSSSYITMPVPGPAVKIAPGALGSFWMTIEGVKPRVKVKFVSGQR